MSFIKVTNITLNSPAEVIVGQPAVQLSATVQPNNATNKTIEWERVSGPGTVNSSGQVSATATGNIVVRARIRNGTVVS